MSQQAIPSQIFIFRSLIDFTQFVNKNLDLHQSELSRYEEELGHMLRNAGDNTNEEWAKEIKSKLSAKETKVSEKKEKGKDHKEPKHKKVKHSDAKNWLTYKNMHIFAGNAAKGKTDVYFEAVNELKAQIDKLKRTKETLDQLSSAGIGNVFYLVYAKNGIPDKLVLIPQETQLAKFEYKADFVTRNMELAVESAEV